MLDVEINDKLIKIKDDNFTKPKISSIRTIVDKYGIREILDFKLTFEKKLFKIAEGSAEVFLSEAISIARLYELLNEIFENIGDEKDFTISFEALFIL